METRESQKSSHILATAAFAPFCFVVVIVLLSFCEPAHASYTLKFLSGWFDCLGNFLSALWGWLAA